MTTYTKEYSDNSHVWMTPVADYAPMMIAHGCTFADFEAKHPCLAKSEYGQDLEATLDRLTANQAFADLVAEAKAAEADLEASKAMDTTEDTMNYLTITKDNGFYYLWDTKDSMIGKYAMVSEAIERAEKYKKLSMHPENIKIAIDLKG